MLLGHYCLSQKKVHVLTKTIKKELSATDKKLIIKGEKSTINISSWSKPFYGIEIKLIAKNLNEKLAKRDLDIIKYKIEETSDYYLLNNFFSSDTYKKIKSNLSTVYNIKVPNSSQLDITNIYGNINIENLTTISSLKNSFGEIHFKDIDGKYQINAYYSDVFMNDVDIELLCNAEKSNIELTDISGSINIKSNYGNLRIIAGNAVKKFNIESKRSTIDFQAKNLLNYNYALSTKYASIILPPEWKNSTLKEGGITKFNLNTNSNYPLIKLKTTYCQISIKNI